MKTLPELLAIAKERLATWEERLSEWKRIAQLDVAGALARAERAVSYFEHREAWSEVVRALERPDTKVTPESLLKYARDAVKRTLTGEGRSTDILERSRVLARAAAWQEVVNAIVEP